MSHDLYGRDKAIALSWHSLDELRRLARVAQRLPDLENGRVDPGVGVGEDIRPPQPLRQVLARHQFSATLQQQQEQIHRLPRESNAALFATQLVRGCVQLEACEAEGHASEGRSHAWDHTVAQVSGVLRLTYRGRL